MTQNLNFELILFGNVLHHKKIHKSMLKTSFSLVFNFHFNDLFHVSFLHLWRIYQPCDTRSAVIFITHFLTFFPQYIKIPLILLTCCALLQKHVCCGSEIPPPTYMCETIMRVLMQTSDCVTKSNICSQQRTLFTDPKSCAWSRDLNCNSAFN